MNKMKSENPYSRASDLVLIKCYEDFANTDRAIPDELLDELQERHLGTGYGDLFYYNCLGENFTNTLKNY